jgi:hypothetical protein
MSVRSGISTVGLLALSAAFGTCAIVLVFLSAAVVGGSRRLDGAIVYFGIPAAALGTVLIGTMLWDWIRYRDRGEPPAYPVQADDAGGAPHR